MNSRLDAEIKRKQAIFQKMEENGETDEKKIDSVLDELDVLYERRSARINAFVNSQ